LNQVQNSANHIAAVSIERAVMCLFREYQNRESVTEWSFDTVEELFEAAYERQLLDSSDFLYRTGCCDRRTFARITHRFLQLVLHEDEDRGKSLDEASGVIQDLSECRTCAGHILQVVHKGIMTLTSERLFQGREPLTSEELEKTVQRVFSREERVVFVKESHT